MLRSAIYAILIVGSLWMIRTLFVRFNVRSVKPDVIEQISRDAAKKVSVAQDQTSVATFGNGCFWCTEAIFESIPGVTKVTSGYSGGAIANPTYRQVCTGNSGHAEVIQITYFPSQVSYTDLLRAFWQSHDPTTLNRQGNDTGTQYRSVIFFHNEKQKELAEYFKKKLNEMNAFGAPVVTEISTFEGFYAAESDHQDYFTRNPNKGYCRMLIQPKLEKFKKAFDSDLSSKK